MGAQLKVINPLINKEYNVNFCHRAWWIWMFVRFINCSKNEFDYHKFWTFYWLSRKGSWWLRRSKTKNWGWCYSENVIGKKHTDSYILIAIKSQVKAEIEHLTIRGILIPVSEPTEWVNQMAVVRKSNGQLRICLDP